MKDRRSSAAPRATRAMPSGRPRLPWAMLPASWIRRSGWDPTTTRPRATRGGDCRVNVVRSVPRQVRDPAQGLSALESEHHQQRELGGSQPAGPQVAVIVLGDGAGGPSDGKARRQDRHSRRSVAGFMICVYAPNCPEIHFFLVMTSTHLTESHGWPDTPRLWRCRDRMAFVRPTGPSEPRYGGTHRRDSCCSPSS